MAVSIHRDYFTFIVESSQTDKGRIHIAKSLPGQNTSRKIHEENSQYQPYDRTTRKPSLYRQRRRLTLLKRVVRNRITRISRIHLHARLIVIGQLGQIHRDLIVRLAAKVLAEIVHGDVDFVHAGIIRRPGRTAVVLREPEAHDARRARVGPVPDADGGVGGVDGGAGVIDNGEAVVPRDGEAGAVVGEEGAVDGGGGNEVDGAIAGIVG